MTHDILYEDKHFIICEKPTGILSQSDAAGGESMVSLLSEGRTCEIFPVHRLDAEVGGVMVYAKDAATAKRLSQLVSERIMVKEYLAIIHGRPQKDSDTLCDLLFKDSSKNKSFVVTKERKGVKEASLDYTVLESKETEFGEASLIKVKLNTGRTHQIRVQFSSRRMPLFGDRRYGSGKDGMGIALWSYRLSFPHPFGKHETVTFSAFPNGDMWDKFSEAIFKLTPDSAQNN